jgi:hypothetical protein
VPIEDIENPILTRVPPFPAFPPEFVFPESSKTIGPSLVIKEGMGRTVYFPDDVDRTFWRSWNHDLGMLLANAVRWAGKDPYSAKVSGPGLLDIFYWETEPGLALHILNYTTPALMKGPARAIYPIGPLEVRLRLPGDFHPGKAMVLSNHLEVAQQHHGHELLLTVPVVNEYEVVAIPRVS